MPTQDVVTNVFSDVTEYNIGTAIVGKPNKVDGSMDKIKFSDREKPAPTVNMVEDKYMDRFGHVGYYLGGTGNSGE